MSARPALAAGTGAGASPRHVALIMDGNGRWAKKRMLPRFAGHKKGVEAVKNIARAAGEMGVEVLTLYAFSTENWRRPEDEVSDLMGLLKTFIERDISELAESGVRLRVIGHYEVLAPELVTLINDAVRRTASNSKLTLVVALNYGSQDEIVRAANKAAEKGAITAEAIDAELDTAGLPPVDLLIRTSGEERLSNFLLWQVAYAEFMFVDTLWPDFSPDRLKACIDSFSARERRYGGL